MTHYGHVIMVMSLWSCRYGRVFAYNTISQFVMPSCQILPTLTSFLKCFKCLSEESYPSSQLKQCDHFWIREGLETINRWYFGTINRWYLGTFNRWHLGTINRWNVGT